MRIARYLKHCKLAVVLIVKRDAFDRPAPWARSSDEEDERRALEGDVADQGRRLEGPQTKHEIEAMSAVLDDLKARSDRMTEPAPRTRGDADPKQ